VKLRVFLVTLLCVAAPGCGSSRPVKYYRIAIPETAAPVSSAPFGVTLKVGAIEAPTLMRDGRILYQSGANEVGAYEYHRWVETPDRIVQNSLVRMLRSSGRYPSVDSPASAARTDYVLFGRIHEFAEVDKPEVFTRISLEIELHDGPTNRTVWSRIYTGEVKVDGKEVADVVLALDRNLRRGLGEIVAGLEEYFAKRPAATSR
jgi:ABC-type uncharacterized transport system auxiliary subunit